MSRSLSGRDRWLQEKGNAVARLAPGLATGINSGREARAVITAVLQGNRSSPLASEKKSLAADALPSAITPAIAGLPFTF